MKLPPTNRLSRGLVYALFFLSLPACLLKKGGGIATSPPTPPQEAVQTSSTPPDVPTGLSAAIDQGSGALVLSWNEDSKDVSGYHIEEMAADGTKLQTFTQASNTTQYSITSLSPNITYKFCVSAYNSGGESACSTSISELLQNSGGGGTVPNAPSNLAVTVKSSSEIDLQWQNNSSNETGFLIEQSKDGQTFTAGPAVGATVTSIAVTGLSASTQYYFRVRAQNATGNSAPSNVVNTTTQAPPITLNAPNNLTATAKSSTVITLAWQNNNAGASTPDYLQIEETPAGGQAMILQVQVAANATTYDVTGLSPSTQYAFRMRGFVTANSVTSAFSNVANATTAAPPPVLNAPSNLAATVTADNKIGFTWMNNNPAASVMGTHIYSRAAGSNGSWTLALTAGPTDTSGSIPAASDGSFVFMAHAFQGTSESPDSNLLQVNVVQTPAAPSGLSGTVTALSATLTWTDNSSNPEETGFSIQRSPDATFATVQTFTVGQDVVSFTDRGLTPGTSYFYRVQSFRTGASSSFSNVAQVTTKALPPPPSKPGALTLTVLADTSIKVSWGASDTPDYYVIDILDSTGNKTTLGQVTKGSLTYTATGLKADTAYTFLVGAVNEGGETDSDAATATTFHSVPPAPVVSSVVASRNGSIDQITVTFSFSGSGPTAAASFNVLRASDGKNFTGIAQLSSSANGYTDQGSLVPGATYTYEVQAVNDGGQTSSAPSSTTAIHDPPPPPTGGLALPASDIVMILTWTDNGTASTDLTKATRVFRRVHGSGNFVQVGEAAGGVTAYSDTGLSAGTIYDYYLEVYNDGGTGDSLIFSGTTIAPSAPGAPAGVIAKQKGSHEIDLTFRNTSTDATAIVITRKDGVAPSAVFKTVATLPIAAGNTATMTYQDTGLAQSTLYSYILYSQDKSGNSGQSDVASDETIPVPPASLAAKVDSSTQITLTWVNSSVNTGYIVQRSSPDDKHFADLVSLPANTVSYVDKSLTPDTSYFYQVKAVNNTTLHVESAFSNEASGTTLRTAPAAPSGLTLSARTQTTVSLSWTNNATNAQKIQIQRRTGVAAFAVVADNLSTTTTSYTDNGLSANTTYFYEVVAINNGGYGASTPLAVTTLPNPPAAASKLVASTVAYDHVVLGWTNNATNATSIKVQRSVDGGKSFATIDTLAATAITYTDVTNLSGSGFSYRIVASNIGGDGSPSNVVSVTLPPATPGAPTALTASAVSSSSITLSWTNTDTNVTGFKIERKLGNSNGSCANANVFAVIVPVSAGYTATTYTDTSLSSSTVYCYRVSAGDAKSTSVPSNQAGAMTTP